MEEETEFVHTFLVVKNSDGGWSCFIPQINAYTYADTPEEALEQAVRLVS